MNKYYAGIGARATPQHVLEVMHKIGSYAAKSGYTLRSGGAGGGDEAFEAGCDEADGSKEIFLPWKGFNENKSPLYNIPKEAFNVAEEFHPYWHKLKPGVKKLMARNVQQVLGANLDKHSEFVLCYTNDGEMSGGTGMAMRVATYYGLPVYNLYHTSPAIILEALKDAG